MLLSDIFVDVLHFGGLIESLFSIGAGDSSDEDPYRLSGRSFSASYKNKLKIQLLIKKIHEKFSEECKKFMGKGERTFFPK